MSVTKSSSYAGMMRRGRRKKYLNCEYRSVYGHSNVRALTQTEIDEFKAHIQRIIDPSLRVQPTFRKAVV